MVVCPPVALGGQVCYTDGMKQKRAIFYIDGFNFYYLALKAKPQYKWLNPKALADGIVHDDTTVACVKYFSARVSGKISQSAHKKQNLYLRALKTVDGIETILGNFVLREKEVTLIPALQKELNRNKVLASIAEEKRTDVNLASHLIYDAFTDKFDIAYVITSDADFIGAIETVTKKINKPVIIVEPRRPSKRQRAHKKQTNNPLKYETLEKVASGTSYINNALLRSSQFPDEIQTKDGNIIIRPLKWR